MSHSVDLVAVDREGEKHPYTVCPVGRWACVAACDYQVMADNVELSHVVAQDKTGLAIGFVKRTHQSAESTCFNVVVYNKPRAW